MNYQLLGQYWIKNIQNMSVLYLHAITSVNITNTKDFELNVV